MSDSEATGIKIITVAEAAAMFGVSQQTMKQRIKDAGISPPRIGRGIVLTQRDLDAVLEAARWRSRWSQRPEATNTGLAALDPRTINAQRVRRTRETRALMKGLRG